MMMMCERLVQIPTMRAQAMERGSTVYTLRERKRKKATWEGEAGAKAQTVKTQKTRTAGLITSPNLLPGRHRSSGKDEDYGDHVESSPHKERQHPSAAPHGGQPG